MIGKDFYLCGFGETAGGDDNKGPDPNAQRPTADDKTPTNSTNGTKTDDKKPSGAGTLSSSGYLLGAIGVAVGVIVLV